MRKNVKYRFFHILITIALSLSIVGIGFGHRAETIEQDQAMQEYILSGGSVWDICSDPSQNDSQAHTQCEACRLVDALGLAQFSFVPQRLEYASLKLASLRSSVVGAVQHVSSHNPVRAPPTFL